LKVRDVLHALETLTTANRDVLDMEFMVRVSTEEGDIIVGAPDKVTVEDTCDEPTLFCDVGFDDLELDDDDDEADNGDRDTAPDPIRAPYLKVVK
jgi:hypothetical protein